MCGTVLNRSGLLKNTHNVRDVRKSQRRRRRRSSARRSQKNKLLWNVYWQCAKDHARPSKTRAKWTYNKILLSLEVTPRKHRAKIHSSTAYTSWQENSGRQWKTNKKMLITFMYLYENVQLSVKKLSYVVVPTAERRIFWHVTKYVRMWRRWQRQRWMMNPARTLSFSFVGCTVRKARWEKFFEMSLLSFRRAI